MANINDEVKALFELKKKIDEMDDAIKQLKSDRDSKEYAILKLLEDAGITEAGVDGLGKVYAKAKIFFAYDKALESDVISFFKADPQLKPLVKETIHSKTFQKAMEVYYEEKNLVPPMVKMAPITKLSTRKASEKSDSTSENLI